MEELKNSYEKNGFLVVPEAGLNKDVLKIISASLPNLLADSKKGFPYLNFSNYGDNTKLQRVTQFHMIKHVFETVEKSNIGRIASIITGSNKIRIWGSQLYIKPHVDSYDANVGIHSEFSEMPFFKSGVLTVWVPFNDVSQENGTLRYFKSSHTEKNNFQYDAINTDIISQKMDMLSKCNDRYEEIPVKLSQGGVSFHHNKLLHYSDQNYSKETRYALAIGLITDDMIIDQSCFDFGYFEILNNLNYCPTIYSR